jgi:hypothetical protein
MRLVDKPNSRWREILLKWCLWGAVVAGLLLPGPVWAAFSVEMTPARLELKADPGKTLRAAIKFRTRGRGSQKVEITKGHFGLDDEGVPLFDTPQLCGSQ